MANDKIVCGSPKHLDQANALRDSDRGPIDWVMDQMGFPKEKADVSKVPCIPKEQYEDSERPKLNSEQRERVNKNVSEFSKAINSGDLTAVGELFNRLAPRAENGVKPDEFRSRSGVKIADETFYQLNKQMGRHGIDFDYRSMGIFNGDRSPSLIISRETQIDQLSTQHLELTLQGGTMKEQIRHSNAERKIIRDYGGPGSAPSIYDGQPVGGRAGETSAETAYREIMQPYRAANKQK